MNDSSFDELKITDAIVRSPFFEKLPENLQNKAKEICEPILDYLGLIPMLFNEYTPHGLSHIITVLNNLRRLLEPFIDALDSEQLFCLLLGAIVHDVGMGPALECDFDRQRHPGLTDDQKGTISKLDASQKERIRQEHHLRAERFVLESPIFQTIPNHQRQAIGRIAKGHRKTSLHSKEYVDRKFPIKDLAFLTAALRLADELEITYERIDFLDIFSDKRNFLLALSEGAQSHWESHLSLEGWALSDSREVLSVRGTVKTELGHRAVELVHESVWNTIKEIRDIEFQNRHVFPLKEDFDLEFQGLVSQRYLVEMEHRSVIGYLIESLYSDYKVAIREVLQNAIDACQLRGSPSAVYQPEISITFRNNHLVVTDNGRGMDLHIIEKYLAVIGRSFYNSRDFHTYVQHADFKPNLIARFGIGMFSLFLISDSFIVRTRLRPRSPQEDSKWYETRFTRAFCPTYSIEKPSDTHDYGTQVEIPLKASVKRNVEEQTLPYLREFFLRPKVPIYYQAPDRIKIGEFPVRTDVGSPQQPTVEYDGMNLRVWAQGLDSIFYGVKVENIEGEKLFSASISLRPAICSEGITLDVPSFNPFSILEITSELIRFLDDLMSRPAGQSHLTSIIDIPAAHLQLTANRTDFRGDYDAAINAAIGEFCEMLARALLYVKQNSIVEAEEFWDHYIQRYYPVTALDDYLDLEEAANYTKMRKGDEILRVHEFGQHQEKALSFSFLVFYHISRLIYDEVLSVDELGAKHVVIHRHRKIPLRSIDINQKAKYQPDSFISDFIQRPLEDIPENYRPLYEEAWIPIANGYFVDEFLIDILKKRGWAVKPPSDKILGTLIALLQEFFGPSLRKAMNYMSEIVDLLPKDSRQVFLDLVRLGRL